MRQSKSFLVLNCEVSSEWDSFTFANIFVKYFSSPADEDKLYEKWDICNQILILIIALLSLVVIVISRIAMMIHGLICLQT